VPWGEKNSLVLEKKGWNSFEESTTTLVNCHLNRCNVITSWACAYVQRKTKPIGFMHLFQIHRQIVFFNFSNLP